MILMHNESKFELTKGGHKMTLSLGAFGWEMITENACTRAYRSMVFVASIRSKP